MLGKGERRPEATFEVEQGAASEAGRRPASEAGLFKLNARGYPDRGSLGNSSCYRALKDRLYTAVAELLSPTRCASCERPGELICEKCRDAMVTIDPTQACVRCGASFGSLLCTECEGIDLAHDRCLAATVFEGPPSRIVRAYKDGGEQRLAQEIASTMFTAARAAEHEDPARYGGLLSQLDAVTFVPVIAAAYRRRGFDHMELVARAFARKSGIPLLDVLAKRGHADQRELSRAERMEQSQRVYVVVAPDLVRGKRLLLLDDVITTGATVSAAACALKHAGAARVDVLAFARVWGE